MKIIFLLIHWRKSGREKFGNYINSPAQVTEALKAIAPYKKEKEMGLCDRDKRAQQMQRFDGMT